MLGGYSEIYLVVVVVVVVIVVVVVVVVVVVAVVVVVVVVVAVAVWASLNTAPKFAECISALSLCSLVEGFTASHGEIDYISIANNCFEVAS